MKTKLGTDVWKWELSNGEIETLYNINNKKQNQSLSENTLAIFASKGIESSINTKGEHASATENRRLVWDCYMAVITSN